MKTKPHPIRIAITSGDTDGIGLEVISKALSQMIPDKNVQFYLWRCNSAPTSDLKRIDKNYTRHKVSSWSEALNCKAQGGQILIDIATDNLPPKWVEQSAHACMSGDLDGIATGPLSKSLILKAKINAIGHTEILKTISKTDHLFMTFIGKKFNVLLCTGHIPISKVDLILNEDLLLKSIIAGHKILDTLPTSIKNKPIALLGLNPHSGEQGIIGQQEKTYFHKVIEQAQKLHILVEGPLVPDAAFLPTQWKKYSMYICPYHDQALIPFKLVHGQDSGVHITAGLPFVRTSVDHGTAKDIFGQNKANPNSMYEALNCAVKLCKTKSIHNRK